VLQKRADVIMLLFESNDIE